MDKSSHFWSVIAVAVQKVTRARGRHVDVYRYSNGELNRFEEIGPGVGLWRDADREIVAVEIDQTDLVERPAHAQSKIRSSVMTIEPQPGERVYEGKTGFTYEVVGVGTAFETEDRIVIYRYGAAHNLFSCELKRWLEAMEDGAMIPAQEAPLSASPRC